LSELLSYHNLKKSPKSLGEVIARQSILGLG
jgi:hypothetical protein